MLLFYRELFGRECGEKLEKWFKINVICIKMKSVYNNTCKQRTDPGRFPLGARMQDLRYLDNCIICFSAFFPAPGILQNLGGRKNELGNLSIQ